MKLFLDDDLESPNRATPDGWDRAVNVSEFKSAIEEAIAGKETIEVISFDNDLGEQGLENEGVGALKLLMNNHPEILRENPEIIIHSANPEAKRNMEKDIAFWRKNLDELIAAKDRPSP